jgi:hypothetical protein
MGIHDGGALAVGRLERSLTDMAADVRAVKLGYEALWSALETARHRAGAPQADVESLRERHDWMSTFGGRRVWPVALQPEDVDVADIAHALSQQCRFAGHTRTFYSTHMCDREDALWGLLHDASEAYLSDLVRPLKHTPWLDGYRELEAGAMRAICWAFGLPIKQPDSVTRADRFMVQVELRDLMNTPADYLLNAPTESEYSRLVPLPARQAELSFIARFEALARPAGASREAAHHVPPRVA